MKYYVYETTPTFISILFGGIDDEYIIENILVYNFITATDNIDNALKKVKKVGGYHYPKQLKWDNGIMTIRVSTPSPWSSLDKLIIICCSESAAEKFEKQVLKNNLIRKKTKY